MVSGSRATLVSASLSFHRQFRQHPGVLAFADASLDDAAAVAGGGEGPVVDGAHGDPSAQAGRALADGVLGERHLGMHGFHGHPLLAGVGDEAGGDAADLVAVGENLHELTRGRRRVDDRGLQVGQVADSVHQGPEAGDEVILLPVEDRS
jgi:hypothetical protein